MFNVDKAKAWAKTLSMSSGTLFLLFGISNVLSYSVHCAEIKIMCPGAYVDVLTELTPGFERATNRKVFAVRDGPSNIFNRIRGGEAADIIILPDDSINELIRDGYIAKSGRRQLAKSGIGMAVRAGASKPDISSVDALKRTLLDAKSIAYSSQISGLYLSTELFPRLGIADQIKSKTKRIERERVGAVVARGGRKSAFNRLANFFRFGASSMSGRAMISAGTRPMPSPSRRSRRCQASRSSRRRTCRRPTPSPRPWSR